MGIVVGDVRHAGFRALNPAAQFLVFRFDNGGVLAQSNAIIAYLASTGPLVPSDAFDRALIMQCMFWEQYGCAPTISVYHFLTVYKAGDGADCVSGLLTGGEAALNQKERHFCARL